jgi:hypothetical protein
MSATSREWDYVIVCHSASSTAVGAPSAEVVDEATPVVGGNLQRLGASLDGAAAGVLQLALGAEAVPALTLLEERWVESCAGRDVSGQSVGRAVAPQSRVVHVAQMPGLRNAVAFLGDAQCAQVGADPCRHVRRRRRPPRH